MDCRRGLELKTFGHFNLCASDGVYFMFQTYKKRKLRITKKNTTGTYLQQLNDDCLLEIFSARSLTTMDLCALGETCTRFQQITGRLFKKQFCIKVCNSGDYEFKLRKYSCGNRAHDAERIFKNFGSMLSAITISTLSSAAVGRLYFALNLVSTYCGVTLECLTIDGMTIPVDLTVKLKPIFKQLQMLELRDVSILSDKTLLAEFDSLIELRLINVRNDSALLENIFPQLKRFTLKQLTYFSDYADIDLSTFISRHTNLKTLDIAADLHDCIILQVIGNSCTELEELSVKLGSPILASCLLPLQALKQLKNLKLFGAQCENLEFIPALTKLHELHLHVRIPLDFYKELASLTELPKLHIYCVVGADGLDVVDIITQLINLEELAICRAPSANRSSKGFVLDEKMFSKIVNVVKRRPNVLTLKCKFNFSNHLENFDEYQMVRLIRLNE